jgi:hypothetical protein
MEQQSMVEKWIGRKLQIQMSEPFDYALEGNQNPLELSILHVSPEENAKFVIVKTEFVYHKVAYGLGVLRSRYGTEPHLLDILLTGRIVVVAASYLPIGHRDEPSFLNGNLEIAKNLDTTRRIPDPSLKDWAHFIGGVRLIDLGLPGSP